MALLIDRITSFVAGEMYVCRRNSTYYHNRCNNKNTAAFGNFQLHLALRKEKVIFANKASRTAVILTDIYHRHRKQCEPVCYNEHSPEYRYLYTIIESDLNDRKCNKKRKYRIRAIDRKVIDDNRQKPDCKYQ